jgi:hypothetical protein
MFTTSSGWEGSDGVQQFLASGHCACSQGEGGQDVELRSRQPDPFVVDEHFGAYDIDQQRTKNLPPGGSAVVPSCTPKY